MKNELLNAKKIIAEALRDDKDLYESQRARLAEIIFDEISVRIGHPELGEVSNLAATKILDSLIEDVFGE